MNTITTTRANKNLKFDETIRPSILHDYPIHRNTWKSLSLIQKILFYLFGWLAREERLMLNMKIEQISEILSSRPKGTYFQIVSRRPAKTRKGVNSYIEKESRIQGQLCDYSATKNVREGIESGEREAPHLPKGVKECFYVGKVNFFRYFNGSVALAVNVSGNKPVSRFFKNGQEVSKDAVESDLLASELAEYKTKEQLADKNQSPFRAIKLDNIKELR